MPRNLGAAIYGLIIVSVLLSAESARQETYGKTVVAVVVALLLYWLAHGYAALVTWRVEEGGRLTPGTFGRMMWHELPILAGAALPLAVVLIEWAVGASLNTAIVVAQITGAAGIIGCEVAAAVLTELTGKELVIQVVVGATLGLLILLLRLVLH